jgi:RNA polymerase sigma-70 factor, ECF subfamily
MGFIENSAASVAHKKASIKEDDEILLKKISARQTAALSELYDRYARLVYSLAYHILEDPSAAEEVTQDVFVHVWDKAATYHPDLGRVPTWLASMARNRSIDMLRRLRVRPEGHRIEFDSLTSERDENDIESILIEGSIDGVEANQSVEPEVEQDLQALKLLHALSHLPEDQRRVLALAYFQGLTQQEIADSLQIPLGTVKTRIKLGLQKLRQVLWKEKPGT